MSALTLEVNIVNHGYEAIITDEFGERIGFNYHEFSSSYPRDAIINVMAVALHQRTGLEFSYSIERQLRKMIEDGVIDNVKSDD